MEVETFLVASALDCVVAQRLARVLCERCKEGFVPEARQLLEAGLPEWRVPAVKELFRAVGGSACFNNRYPGRGGVLEGMPVAEGVERPPVGGAWGEQIRAAVLQGGVCTLV